MKELNSFTAYDMALLYNCKLLVKSINYIKNEKFDDKAEDVKKVIRNILKNPEQAESVDAGYSIVFNRTVEYGCYYKMDVTSDKGIFYGYVPQLLNTKIKNKKRTIENYLFGVALSRELIESDLIDRAKLDKMDFCQDEKGWVYLPVERDLTPEQASADPCACDSIEGELKLDIC